MKKNVTATMTADRFQELLLQSYISINGQALSPIKKAEPVEGRKKSFRILDSFGQEVRLSIPQDNRLLKGFVPNGNFYRVVTSDGKQLARRGSGFVEFRS